MQFEREVIIFSEAAFALLFKWQRCFFFPPRYKVCLLTSSQLFSSICISTQAWLTEIHEYAQKDVVIMLLGNKVSGTSWGGAKGTLKVEMNNTHLYLFTFLMVMHKQCKRT